MKYSISSFLILQFFIYGCSDIESKKRLSPPELNARSTKQTSMKMNSIPDSVQGMPPPIETPDIYGNYFSLANAKGKVVILNFWGTWCAPCIAEIPEFIDLQNEYSKNDLLFIGISTPNEPIDSVRKFIEEIGVNYTIIYDSDKNIIDRYRPSGWPSSYIIGQDGKLEKIIIGSTNSKLLRPVLKEIVEAE